MEKDTWRVVTRAADGELIIRDFDSPEQILRTHLQVGTDDCSTDLALRGAPIFRSLVGPMPEGRNVVRYESPEVFECLTKEWAVPLKSGAMQKPRRLTSTFHALSKAHRSISGSMAIIPGPNSACTVHVALGISIYSFSGRYCNTISWEVLLRKRS